MSMEYKIRGTKVVLPYEAKLTPAETRLVFRLQKIFNPQNIFPEIYLPKVSKRFTEESVAIEFGKEEVWGSELTQIDCIAIDRRGVFVFESKDFSGFVFGNGKQKYWTQTLDFGRTKNHFPSPIIQNETHVRALKSLTLADMDFWSIIVFGLETTLKSISEVPHNVSVCKPQELSSVIAKIIPRRFLDDKEIEKMRAAIIANRINPTPVLRQAHITGLIS